MTDTTAPRTPPQPLTEDELRMLALDVLAATIAKRLRGDKAADDEKYWALVGEWVALGPQAVLVREPLWNRKAEK